MPQHRHTFHEKLVEIGGEDREKLCFFEQRRTLVESLGKNALIEVQPTEIAIDPDIRQILRQGSVQHPVITDRCKSRHAHEMSSRELLHRALKLQFDRRSWACSRGGNRKTAPSAPQEQDADPGLGLPWCALRRFHGVVEMEELLDPGYLHGVANALGNSYQRKAAA